MAPPLPAYYTRLAPFRDLFDSGFPVLTYHKFGAAPRGARLRGMYLRPGLLDRQLRELKAAGFAFADRPLPGHGPSNPGAGGPPPAEAGPAAGRSVALTIDDGFASVYELAMPVLARHGARALLYLVADRLGGRNDWEVAQGEVERPLMSHGQVREWLAAGHRIGGHTLTHPWLTRIPVAGAREEIGAGRRRLEDLFGVPVTDFCYPYGDWNAAVRDVVREAGYLTAVTTDFGVNGPGQDAFALRRVTARYASRGWPWLRARWRGLWGGRRPWGGR